MSFYMRLWNAARKLNDHRETLCDAGDADELSQVNALYSSVIGAMTVLGHLSQEDLPSTMRSLIEEYETETNYFV